MSIVSVSREAGPPQAGHCVRTQSSAAASGERPRGAKSLIVGQDDGQLIVGHGHDPAPLAVDDRDRTAPVALA